MELNVLRGFLAVIVGNLVSLCDVLMNWLKRAEEQEYVSNSGYESGVRSV